MYLKTLEICVLKYTTWSFKLRELHNDLLFLPERMKIEKVKKLVANVLDKTEYLIDMINLEQALNYG